MPANDVLALADDPDIKAQLQQDTENAAQRGLFGLPTMFVGEEMLWGQDRLDFVREALLGAPANHPS